MNDPSAFTILLIIFIPSVILTAIILWIDRIQQKKEKDWLMRHHH